MAKRHAGLLLVFLACVCWGPRARSLPGQAQSVQLAKSSGVLQSADAQLSPTKGERRVTRLLLALNPAAALNLAVPGCKSLAANSFCPARCHRVGYRSPVMSMGQSEALEVLHFLPASVLVAFFDPIQGIRDATQAIFYSGEVRTTVLTIVISSLVSGGWKAWRAGESFRERADTANLGVKDFGLLAACLAIDLAGDVTFFLPGGELDDVIWAPISSLLLAYLFKSDRIPWFNLGKELLPLTDVLPVATLAWLLRYGFPDSAVSRFLNVTPPTADGDPPALQGKDIS